MASLLLRLVGIGWGLPNDLHNQSYHPDETQNYGVSKVIDIAHGKLTPGFYNYGTAYFIAENIANKVVDAYGGAPVNTDLKSYWLSIGRGILVGRIISALAGAGTVVVVWLILRRITTRIGALFGAGLVAIAPGFLVHSRFETPDVFSTFWLALSALFSLRLFGSMPGSEGEDDNRQPKGMRDALLAGLFAGIATGSKYSCALVILALWASLALTRRPGWYKPLLAGTVACLASFVLTTPGFLLDSDSFWRDFGFELGHTATGHGLVFIGTSSGYLYHLGNLFVGVGVLATAVAAFGLVYASVKKQAWAIACLVFFVAYYLVIGHAEVKFLRYTFPLLVPMAISYGYAVGTAFRRKDRLGYGLAAVGVFALSGNPFFDFGGLIGAAKYTQFMSGTDPRDEAALYLKDVDKNGTVGFVKDPWFYSPPLIPDAGLNRGSLRTIYEEVAESSHPKVVRYIPSDGPPIDWDVRLLTESKPDYVVFSSYEANDEERLSSTPGLTPETQQIVDRYKQFRDELQKRYDYVAPFGGQVFEIHDLMYIRPTLWVWKRKDVR